MTKKNTGVQDVPVESSAADQLDIKPYARALADFASSCPTPMTIAVQGDWGIGKTSLMHCVLSEIKALAVDKAAHTFWINTWEISQFNLGDSISLTFLSAVISRMQQQNERLEPNKKEKAVALLKRMGGVVGVAGNILVNGAAMAVSGVSVGNMMEGTGAERRRDINPLEEIDKLRSTFAEMCALLAGENGRVVFFIDDLDRIQPERAVELLEVMKNFLDVKSAVFVLAIDYEVVNRGLRKKFGEASDDGAASGKRFFDKIIQVPFSMPSHAFNLDRYVGTIADSVGLPTAITANFVEIVKTTGLTNPRSIKRAINTLLLQRAVLKIEGGAEVNETSTTLAFAAVCIEATSPIHFRQLTNDAGDLSEALAKVGAIGAFIGRCIGSSNGQLHRPGVDAFRQVMRNAQLTTSEAPLVVSENRRINAFLRDRSPFQQMLGKWFIEICVENGSGAPIKPNDGNKITLKDWDTELFFSGSKVMLNLGYTKSSIKNEYAAVVSALRDLPDAARFLRGPGQPMAASSFSVEIEDGDEDAFEFAKNALQTDIEHSTENDEDDAE